MALLNSFQLTQKSSTPLRDSIKKLQMENIFSSRKLDALCYMLAETTEEALLSIANVEDIRLLLSDESTKLVGDIFSDEALSRNRNYYGEAIESLSAVQDTLKEHGCTLDFLEHTTRSEHARHINGIASSDLSQDDKHTAINAWLNKIREESTQGTLGKACMDFILSSDSLALLERALLPEDEGDRSFFDSSVQALLLTRGAVKQARQEMPFTLS